MTRGQPLYMQTCIACHQPTGMGLPGAFPPLAKSDYATGDARRMVAMILKGVQGPLTVNGVQYNNIMLPLDVQFPVLKDDAKVGRCPELRAQLLWKRSERADYSRIRHSRSQGI
jgi:hypothetical protein